MPEGGIHAFGNDGDHAASILILFAPGSPRERYFAEVTEIDASGPHAELRRVDRALRPARPLPHWAKRRTLMSRNGRIATKVAAGASAFRPVVKAGEHEPVRTAGPAVRCTGAG